MNILNSICTLEKRSKRKKYNNVHRQKKKRIIFCEDLYAVSVRSSQHLSTYVIGKRHAEINMTPFHLEIGKAWEATAPTSSQHGRAELQSWENMY